MKRKAFTLVEILIVVIILGILAAIVIPQFTEASNDARAAAVSSDEHTIRGQLELFKMQHLGSYPAAATLGVAATCQLLNKTDIDGTINAAGKYGPYLTEIPINPYTNTTKINTADADNAWDYDATTGSFVADPASIP